MNTTGRPPDLDEVIQLDQDFFPAAWTRAQWEETNWGHHVLYPFKENGHLIGFALFGVFPGEHTAHLYKILLHPDKRGSNLTEELWSATLGLLKNSGIQEIYLEVNSQNQRAIGFYEKNGFKLVRRSRAYYSNGEDALIMSLTL